MSPAPTTTGWRRWPRRSLTVPANLTVLVFLAEDVSSVRFIRPWKSLMPTRLMVTEAAWAGAAVRVTTASGEMMTPTAVVAAARRLRNMDAAR